MAQRGLNARVRPDDFAWAASEQMRLESVEFRAGDSAHDHHGPLTVRAGDQEAPAGHGDAGSSLTDGSVSSRCSQPAAGDDAGRSYFFAVWHSRISWTVAPSPAVTPSEGGHESNPPGISSSGPPLG